MKPRLLLRSTGGILLLAMVSLSLVVILTDVPPSPAPSTAPAAMPSSPVPMARGPGGAPAVGAAASSSFSKPRIDPATGYLVVVEKVDGVEKTRILDTTPRPPPPTLRQRLRLAVQRVFSNR